MSSFSYYLAWLGGGLLAIAVISAIAARQLRLRALRRMKAAQALDALARYCDWVAAQRRTPYFKGDTPQCESPLQEIHAIRQHWFPELSADAADIFAMHARLLDFLWAQQSLRLLDPEAWLESDHDGQFMDLWREHLDAVQRTAEKLKRMAGAQDLEAEPEATFSA